MGLEKRAHSNYIRLKDGKFYLGKDMDNPYDELTGRITNFSFKDDEFEGMKIRKLVININDGETEYTLSFPFDSAYASSLISFLKNADLTRELTLVPVYKEEGDKASRSILVKQGGKWMSSYYTKDNPHGQPSMKKIVKKSGKVEWDKEDFLEFRENVILKELLPSVTGKAKSIDETSTDDEVITADELDDNDLPF